MKYPEISVEALGWINSIVPNCARPESRRPASNRLFLSRSGFQFRQIRNQVAVEQILRANGFDSIEPSLLSVAEQADRFRSASIVVGPQGSAFSNLVFCRPDTHIVEFFGADKIHLLNRQLALTLGLNHNFLLDPRSHERSKRSDGDVEVDIESLEQMLLQIIG